MDSLNHSRLGDIVELVPKRLKKSHKGTYGRLLVIAGSDKYTGAASLTVEAALRTGAGMVFVVTTNQVAGIIRLRSPEAIVIEAKADNGAIDPSEIDTVCQSITDYNINACCIGPGIGHLSETQSFFDQLLMALVKNKITSIIDADALTPMHTAVSKQKAKNQTMVFTPHPKEFSKMTKQNKLTIGETNVINTCKQINQVICYKTDTTFVSDGQKHWRTTTGNESLATAGSGDVLSGIIAGLLAQHLTPFNAAKLGVYLHGRAAELASSELGKRSVLARDLCGYLSKCYQELK